MSFSNDVRKEICESISDKNQRYSCLYGALLFSRTLSRERIVFQTESRISADTFSELFSRVFKTEPLCRTNERKSGSVLYTFDIDDRELIGSVMTKYRIDPELPRHINSEIITTSSLGIFTAGIFLACGSVNDPSKEYHLEFSAPEEALAGELVALLADIGVKAKTVLRRGAHIVYIKGSESIEDTLTFIGAQQCTLEIMNVKIYKDVRNKVNRIANCDSANIDKVVNAAMKQIEDIRLIASVSGLDSLTPELREVAELRLENSGMSLSDIGEALSESISRSGVNHRFKKLAKIADDIRKRGGYES
ncbi:MAG: DNA-binding protein WhiA [Ruminococcus sp.]|nr:DNA-binding protein WhiA [Ruminococcus sp.]